MPRTAMGLHNLVAVDPRTGWVLRDTAGAPITYALDDTNLGHLPDAEDRFLCKELFQRKEFPVAQVLPALREMSQENLLATGEVTDVDVNAVLSKSRGLKRAPEDLETTDSVTLAPETGTERG